MNGTFAAPRSARSRLAFVGRGPTTDSPGPEDVLGLVDLTPAGLLGPLEVDGLRDLIAVMFEEAVGPMGTKVEGPGARSIDDLFARGAWKSQDQLLMNRNGNDKRTIVGAPRLLTPLMVALRFTFSSYGALMRDSATATVLSTFVTDVVAVRAVADRICLGEGPPVRS